MVGRVAHDDDGCGLGWRYRLATIRARHFRTLRLRIVHHAFGLCSLLRQGKFRLPSAFSGDRNPSALPVDIVNLGADELATMQAPQARPDTGAVPAVH